MGSEAKWPYPPWRAHRIVHFETGEALTPEEIGEYVKNTVLNSAEESGTTDFLIVSCEKPDGPADICHVGNGPNAKAIAPLLAAAPLLAEAVRYVLEWAEHTRAMDDDEYDESVRSTLRAALAAATPEGQPSVEHACSRCDADTEPDLLRAYEDGAPMQCSRCGLDIDEPSAEWLRAHGYTPEGQERGA